MTVQDKISGAQVFSAPSVHVQNAINPQTAITIAVDTAYIVGAGGGVVSGGIYMFDNRLTNGSRGEGSLELNTHCNRNDYIGFEVVPIDPNTGDTVSIIGFQVSSGTVFGSDGYPMQIQPDYWIGQARNAAPTLSTYQIQIKIVTGGLRPRTVVAQWDPFIGLN